MPDLSYERACGYTHVCGIDEAGRGPLAGPVVAAAVIFSQDAPIDTLITDSKKLSANMREALYEHIIQNAHVGIGQCSADEIDQINILQATLLAMKRAAEALPHAPQYALIDGNKAPTLICPTQCIVKGDTLSVSIAAASIIAKVTRDRIMHRLGQIHPQYGFEKHSGYGTQQHLQALAQYGALAEHRRSFAPVKSVLEHAA